MKKHKNYIGRIIGFSLVWGFIIAVNLFAWKLEGFSDWCIDHITPVWVNVCSRIMNFSPISVGEILLTVAVVLLVVTVILLVLLIFLFKKKKFRKTVGGFLYFDAVVATIVCIIMTFNCSVLYHAKPIDANPEKDARKYTVEELMILRNYIVDRCNELSSRVAHDEKNEIVYEGDMQTEARKAETALGAVYPRLDGYYPDVKPMIYSTLMCQSYMTGYYFPFSMEANANKYMYIINTPYTYCHELSHLHGYIYEDEANFIAFLACINSEDEFFRYSGYMNVLNYVVNAFWKYEVKMNDEERATLSRTNEVVDKDNIFLTEEMWDMVERSSRLSTEKVTEISNTFTDTTLKVNGVDDGMASYGRVVGLLLEYYDGKLY